MTRHTQTSPAPVLRRALCDAVGADGFDDAGDRLELVSQDIWAAGETAAFIASPDSIDALARLVRVARDHGVALNPRGAGMSYTKAYTPDRTGVGIVDFSRLNRIVEINADDMYVTVEAGCSWAALHDALSARKLRTPFWGPLSGLASTIGGGVSQNNAFFGAGRHGPSSDSVISLTVVLADGSVIRTGSAARTGAKPFFRHYGPDITGLFCGDGGAFGFKAQVTLKLIPAPVHEDGASFAFGTRDACAEAMAAVMRANLAAEVFGFDPSLQRIRLRRASLMSDVKTLGNVMLKQGSMLKGLQQGAKIAIAGRAFVDADAYALHFVCEGESAAGVREDLAILRRICRDLQGKEIENSIPKIVRANPFGPLNAIIGPGGERWAPVHGIVPASEGKAAWAEIETLFDSRRDELEARAMMTGALLTTLGASGFLIEPVLYWPEEQAAIHRATVEPDFLARLPRHEAHPENTALVAELRQSVIDIFARHGASHFQIGRTYPYRSALDPATRALVDAIKAVLDPEGRVNPGALGFNTSD